MVAHRTLPERRNPLIDAAKSPSHEILVERRRLGQTRLDVKPGIIGVTNASKAEHLGTFDYVHLRVPLPKDLSGSGVFTLRSTTAYPESYFLMRRSSDGFISATGMFKAAFPWSSRAEEEAERMYQKTLPSAGPAEVAGSVWVAPEEALPLSEQYGIRHWIVALLDPAPIEKGNKDKNVPIQTPPRFDTTKLSSPAPVHPPTPTLRSTRTRSSRSASPSKNAALHRKIVSPRKPRKTRAAKAEAAVLEEHLPDTALTAASNALLDAVEKCTNAPDLVASEPLNGEVEKIVAVQVEVQETYEDNSELQTTTTNVQIDLPADYPNLPTPEDPTKMIEEARRMVQQARGLTGGGSTTVKSKRKAEVLKDEDELEESSLQRPAKLARTGSTVEQKLAKERMTRRALVGLGVMTAIGSAVSYFANLA